MQENKPNAELAKMLAAICVRNTYLEDLHAGTTPSSKTGDYSDVKVVTPYGEIPWNDLSRFDDDEMKKLVKEVVNNLYSFFERLEDPAFMPAFEQFARQYTHRWDEPEYLSKFDNFGAESDKLL